MCIRVVEVARIAILGQKAPDEIFSCHFCTRRKAVKFCHTVYIQRKTTLFLQKFHFVFCPGNEELPAWPVVVSDAHQQHGEEAEWDNFPGEGEKTNEKQQQQQKYGKETQLFFSRQRQICEYLPARWPLINILYYDLKNLAQNNQKNCNTSNSLGRGNI